MEILVPMIFLLMFIVNISKFKGIKIRVYLSRFEKIVLILGALILIFTAYTTSSENNFPVLPYLTAVFAALFFVSGVAFKGIGEDGIHASIGRGLLVVVIPFEEIESVYIKDKKGKDYFELKIKSDRGRSYERFLLTDKKVVKAYLKDVEFRSF